MSNARERAAEILKRHLPDMPRRDIDAFIDAIVELVQEQQRDQLKLAHLRVFGQEV